eukprot:455805_1
MAHRKSKFQEFPPGDEEERTFQIKVKDTPLQSTSDVIFYFYHKHRLLHPNELERIQMEGERIILIFLNVELAMIFYMKCFHPQTPPKDKFELIFGPVNFRSESYIHRNCMRLDACVLQRPVYPKLSPLKTRTKARAISRYNALCIMRFDKNACVCTILNQPYSNPNNRNTPLHRLPPPMLERFELNKHKVENYFIAENKALRNNMGNFEDILNPGKKMSRMGLYNTKCTALTTLKLSDIEVIDDPHAKNGKQLTDGCCIINERITRTNIGHPVVSMLSRFGGAKCMLVSLPSSLIAKVIRRDQDHKRKHYLTEIDKEKQKIHPNQSKLVEWDMILRENENRNFKAQAVITESSMKFQFEKFSLEVAVASFTESKGAFMNREFIAAGYYHYYRKDQTKQFEDHLQRYALKWFGILNAARTTHDYDRIPRQAAEIFVYQESHKRRNKYLLQDMQKWNTGPFITRKHDHRSIQKLVKESWVKAVEKLRIGLPWPSCKIEGVADWTQTLAEHEIFLKIKVPPTTAVLCPQCPLKFDPFMFVCSNCRSPRPKYYVYEGECGLLKSPCMHPRSYKRFTAVYNQLLDDLFDGECLLFSTSPECKTSPVFAMSGADLDGDDFLVVTQQELIPLHDGELADVEVQKFDEQGVRADPEYIDDHTMIDYFLEYALLENTAELAVLHEAFSEHHVEGIGHHQCIEIAKYHSFALDFSKTGKPGILPDELGIPTLVDVRTDQLIIYPHYMGKHPCFRSRMIKGRVYDFVVSQLPMEYYKDCKIYKDHELQRMPDKPRLHKVAPQKIEKAYHNDNMMNRRRDGNMDNEEMEEYEFEWMKPPI